MLNSLFSAFLMYSRIPVPQVEWKEENRRYSLCFFPVIGVVIGIIQILLWILCSKYGIGRGLYAALAVAVPVMVTGGIHLDGYMDVHDAKGCMGDRERKLQVMKDSRIGAFAAIYLILYFILQFGMFYEVRTSEVIYVIAFASNSQNLLDIIPAWELMQKSYPKKQMKIIGLAKGYEDALELVRTIIDETYQNTGDVDVWKYLKEERRRMA